MSERSISERLDDIAISLAGYDEVDDLPQRVSQLACELRELERLYPPDDGFPNPRQSLALGRFLNQAMRDDRFEGRPHDAYATVSRSRIGVGGISENYLGVRFADGYEGGIDREGRVST